MPFLDLKGINNTHASAISAAMQRVLESGWYIMGRELEQFETEFARHTGVNHAIGVANGLDALILILEAYKKLGKLSDGDEVIVPANTYIASILAISKAGLTPVLVEPNEATFNLSAVEVAKHIGPRTKAVMAVHLYGQLADVEEISTICLNNNLLLIEDAAQAHGAHINGRRAGAWGHATGFSFYPGKNLGALGDAGAITTNDSDLDRMVRVLRNYGSEVKYHNLVQGVNSRLDELQAAVLSVKLPYIDSENEARRQIAEQYNASITNSLVGKPQLPPNHEAHVWHLYVVRCAHRQLLIDHLKQNGVDSLIHYPIPPHKQPAYAHWNALSYPITEAIHQQVLSLPLFPHMSASQVEQVIEAINSFEV